MKKLLLISLILIIMGAVGYILYNRLYISEGIKINPNVELDPLESYHVSCWLYPLEAGLSGNDEIPGLKERLQEWQEIRVGEITIQIDYQLADLDSGHYLVKDRIARNRPPDLYFNLLQEPFLEQVVPVDLYLKKDNYQDWALLGSSWGKRIISWPVAGWPVGFFIGRESFQELGLPPFLQEHGVITIEHLFSDEALDTGLELLIPVEELFYIQVSSILHNFLLDAKLNPSEKEYFGRLAADYSRYYSKKNSPGRSINSLLAEGRGIIGPVNPWLHHLLEEQMNNAGFQGYFVLLGGRGTRPESSEKMEVYCQVYGLNQFYQLPYPGDKHTKASAEAASFLAERLGGWLAERLGMLEPGKAVTVENVRGDRIEDDQTDDGITGKPQVLTGVSPYIAVHSIWREHLLPALKRYWEDELTAEELEQVWEEAAAELKGR
ncbi:MAG: hypothetical protein UMV23_00680 [Halanaerobium sp.]|nr:hypothetical protein [Halanaerobium sp.]